MEEKILDVLRQKYESDEFISLLQIANAIGSISDNKTLIQYLYNLSEAGLITMGVKLK